MPRKHFIFAAALSAVALLLGGCAAGFNAATNAQGNSGNGRSADVGSLQIRNATVVVDPADPTRATVLMTIINNDDATDDVLIGIATADSVSVEEEVKISLPKRGVVNIGFKSDYRIVLTNLSGLVAGEFVNVSLMLESGQSVPLSLLINEKTGIYSETEIPARQAQPAPAPIPSAS
jgi:copper(I)-binding protein